jgi:hypothetical protein
MSDSALAPKPLLIHLANKQGFVVGGEDPIETGEWVTRLIFDNEIVWAVWEDATESLGHGMILIKGHGKFRELTASVMEGRGDTFGVAAIKYSSLQ